MSAETDKLLHHPEVVKVIDAVLRACGFRSEHALDDGRQTVYLKALAAKGRRPETIEGWKALTRKIAKGHGIDELRKRRAGKGANVGLTDEADEADARASYRPRWDERDARKALEVLFMMIDEGYLPRDFEHYLDAVANGVSQKQLATEAGLPEDLYNKQVWRARGRAAARLTALGLGLALLWFVVWPFVAPNHVAHHGSETSAPDAGLPGPGTREPPPPQAMVDTHHEEEVAALRAQIAATADAGAWEKCLELYRKLDGLEPRDPDKVDPIKTRCVDGLTGGLVGKSRHEDAGKPGKGNK